MTLHSFVFVVLDNHLAAREHGVDMAINDKTLPSRMVHVHVVGLVEPNLGAPNRVVNNDIGV